MCKDKISAYLNSLLGHNHTFVEKKWQTNQPNEPFRVLIN